MDEEGSEVELFIKGNQHSDHPPPQPRLDRRRSFRAISKMNPEIVKSVLIASAAESESESDHHTFNNSLPPPPPPPHYSLSHHLPVFKSHPSTGWHEEAGSAPLMTIFYKGTVSIFDMPNHKAEEIMKFAFGKDNSNTTTDDGFHTKNENSIIINDGDLPIKRKKSLQRFFEKRKQRLIAVSPYTNPVAGPIHQKTSV